MAVIKQLLLEIYPKDHKRKFLVMDTDCVECLITRLPAVLCTSKLWKRPG